MVQPQIKTGVLLVFLALFITGTFLATPATASDFDPSQPTTAPNIWDWGYTGNPNASQPFSVWANVTAHPDGLGIANVTMHATGPNVTRHDLMTFNGSFYELDLEAFPNPGQFILWVSAMDLNDDTRDGRIVYITIEDDTDPTVDPLLTMPAVVSTSILIAVVVMVFALMYDRKQIELAGQMEPADGTIEPDLET
jgi:hypothetical protein